MRTFLNKVIFIALFSLVNISCKNHKSDKNIPKKEFQYKNDWKKLLEPFKNDIITESKTKESIPDFIFSFLEENGNAKSEIANPGELWNGTDAKQGSIGDTTNLTESQKHMLDATVNLPDKQLISFGIGKQTAFISFRKGSFVPINYFYVIMFNCNLIVDYWYGMPGFPVENTTQAISYMEGEAVR